jgi:hypothetical protein
MWRLLIQALGMNFGLRPHTPMRPQGLPTFLLACAVLVIASTFSQWWQTPSPRVFDADGLHSDALTILLIVIGSTVCARLQRSLVLTFSFVSMLILSLAWFSLIFAAWQEFISPRIPDSEIWQWIDQYVPLIWWALVCGVVGHFVIGAGMRAAALGTLVGAALVASWLYLPAHYYFSTAQTPSSVYTQRFDAEKTMYAQTDLLAAQFAALQDQTAGQVDLYFLGLAGDSGETTFRNEITFAANLMTQRFNTPGKSIKLINHDSTVNAIPMANQTALERSLKALATHMNAEEDVLWIYLASHGSKDHRFIVSMPPYELHDIDPTSLRRALDASGIINRVVVVSSCYSGGFVDALKSATTLIMTAARADRTSFGCGVDSQYTYFGRAFLLEALNDDADFLQAFPRACERIKQREQSSGVLASEPQIWLGASIQARLQRWNAALRLGAKVSVPANTKSADDS